MTSRFIALCLLVSLCSLNLCAFQQIPPNSEYFFRLEKMELDREVCALVFTNGQFRWEEARQKNTVVLEGALSPAKLAEIQQLINAPRMLRLRQSDISTPLLSNEFQPIFLSIMRANTWQNLHFPTPETRQPYKEILGPLLTWLKAAHKTAQRLPERSANNCLPPRTFGLLMRAPDHASMEQKAGATNASELEKTSQTGDEAETRAPAQVGPRYLVRWQNNAFIGTTAKRDCAIVFADRSYRYEKTSQDLGGKPKIHIFEGTLSEEEVREVGHILDAAELKGMKSADVTRATVFREAQITDVSIPRTEGIQSVKTVRFFGVPGRLSNTAYEVTDDRPLKPLLSWIKATIMKRKSEPLKDVPSNSCQPRQ